MLQGAVRLLGHLDQFLDRSGVADRHHQPPATRELGDQSLGNMASTCRGKDCVERGVIGAAFGPVALDDLDIVIAEATEPLACNSDQRIVPFDRDHLTGDAADHRRCVSRAGTDLEHRVAGLDRRAGPRSGLAGVAEPVREEELRDREATVLRTDAQDLLAVAEAGSLLGTGALMVMDETDCVVAAAERMIGSPEKRSAIAERRGLDMKYDEIVA